MNAEFIDLTMATDIESFYRSIDVLGVFLMGIIGGTIARHRGYDIIGFFFLALFSALGGGMIRDMLLGHGTVAAMREREYLILAFAGAFTAWLFRFRGKVWEIVESHGDAIISGSWAVTGATKALTYDLPLLSCLFMGVLTAVGGGMVRDVVTGEQPRVFGGNQLAAVPAILAALVCCLMYYMDLQFLGMIAGLIVGAGLSIASYWFNWQLHRDPNFSPISHTARHFHQFLRSARDRVAPNLVRRSRGSRAANRDLEAAESPSKEFESALRELHSDNSPAGQARERQFISDWLNFRRDSGSSS